MAKIKHGLCGTPTYISWNRMTDRCNNPNSKQYCYYGGRGITVCDSWLKFINFLNTMGVRPEKLTLERINNNKGYYKENCRWASRSEQQRNKRIRKSNKTGVNGVRWSKHAKKFMAHIKANGKCYYLGLFNTIKEAAEARKQGELKYWA